MANRSTFNTQKRKRNCFISNDCRFVNIRRFKKRPNKIQNKNTFCALCQTSLTIHFYYGYFSSRHSGPASRSLAFPDKTAIKKTSGIAIQAEVQQTIMNYPVFFNPLDNALIMLNSLVSIFSFSVLFSSFIALHSFRYLICN